MAQDENKTAGGLGLLPMIVAFVAGVVLVASIVAGAVFFRQAQQRGDELAAQEDAARAACQFAKATNTYDYTGDLDAFLQTMKDGATENVVSSLEKNWDVMRQLLTESQVKSWVDEVTCGFQSGDAENAKVLVNIGLMKTNSLTPEPRRQDIAVVAGMEKSGDRWIVNKWELAMLAGIDAQGGQPAPAPGPQAAPGEQPAPRRTARAGRTACPAAGELRHREGASGGGSNHHRRRLFRRSEQGQCLRHGSSRLLRSLPRCCGVYRCGHRFVHGHTGFRRR